MGSLNESDLELHYSGADVVLPVTFVPDTPDGTPQFSLSVHEGACVGVEASPRPVVQGRVVDAEGHPVAGARVRGCGGSVDSGALGQFWLHASGSLAECALKADCAPMRLGDAPLSSDVTSVGPDRILSLELSGTVSDPVLLADTDDAAELGRTIEQYIEMRDAHIDDAADPTHNAKYRLYARRRAEELQLRIDALTLTQEQDGFRCYRAGGGDP